MPIFFVFFRLWVDFVQFSLGDGIPVVKPDIRGMNIYYVR